MQAEDEVLLLLLYLFHYSLLLILSNLQSDDSFDDPLLFLLLPLNLASYLQQFYYFLLHLLFPSLSSKRRPLATHPLHNSGLLLILLVLLARHDYNVEVKARGYNFIDGGNYDISQHHVRAEIS